jgi:hypothetical protein
MARTPTTRPRRTHQTSVLAIAAGAAAVTVAVAVVAAWTLLVRSSDNPTRSALAATSPSTASPAPTTDAIPTNPQAPNEPATVARYLDERCHSAPPGTPETVDELIPTLQTCLASNPPNTASTQTTPGDLGSLWQLLGTLPAAQRDYLVTGLPPDVRAGLARITEIAGATALIK